MTQNKRATGSHYEQQVAAFLKQQGYKLLEQNFRCKSGEIDLIARDGRHLVFIEVKYRKTSASGWALEAIDQRKAARIRRTAQIYLWKNGYPETMPCRFDAIGIDGERMVHIKNAFE